MARVSTAEIGGIAAVVWLIVGLGQMLDGNDAAAFGAFILAWLMACRAVDSAE